jgi:hypothetical protein
MKHPDDTNPYKSCAKSESELSVLIDARPKKKRESTSKSEGKVCLSIDPAFVSLIRLQEAKKPRVKKEAPTLSKDEERIKRLKVRDSPIV